MSFNGSELEYDGHKISEFKGFLGGINRDSIQEINSMGTFESLTSMSVTSPEKRDNGGKYTEGLTREIQVCWVGGISIDDYAEFCETFFNKKYYAKLSFPDSYRQDYYYMAKLIVLSKTTINDVITEVKFEVDYQSPYGILHTPQTIHATSGTYTHECESHFDGDIYPIITLTGTGNVTLTNTTNGSKFIITLNSTTETVVVDDMLQITTNDTTKKYKLSDVDLTNGKFFYLSKGTNNFTVEGNVRVDMSYKVYKKVGA